MRAKKTMGIIGEQFIKDTTEYRMIPKAKRADEMFSILDNKPELKPFLDKFPVYHIQYTWNYSEKDLAAYIWEPSTKPRALVLNFHALNAHTGLSGSMAKNFAESGMIVAGFDYENFGKSTGAKRGHIQSVEELVTASESFLTHTTRKYPGIPVYVTGLSMGGLIALQVGINKQNQIDGCIFFNPALRDNYLKNRLLKRLMVLAGTNLPGIQTLKPMKGNGSNYSLQQYKKHDNLMYTGGIWTSTTAALLNNMKATRQRFGQFSLPYLCIQGGSDKVLNPFTVFDFEDACKSHDKETVIIHSLWHAMWFDDNCNTAVQMAKQWILRRI